MVQLFARSIETNENKSASEIPQKCDAWLPEFKLGDLILALSHTRIHTNTHTHPMMYKITGTF